ncbi:ubiquitin-conjugating enzyme E2 G1 [Puccinia graminis f. sp. tritici CRL 75-36-700-3]|uniref:Ubiquitin-conjugating enzyme E2 G1 n=1 Tax=Puccinia graminis f. sp. tritici (strain CRL 75-36-700-3 / race SCCL) TaxID=418459 RepID=E3JV40_PUCGT|nr:ubiquitin-conjugating enzyme E2 G1 [Puccinia graminis f. sp. tritici CRL 75-36-700-3]EFP75915.2 ubiquitin-conjugating enzyme E2 G1 [Puccinia graminis f. sp. tritici CRL 75-36-700-3]
MSFPAKFPLLPPKLRFTTQMWHPNIYPDGTVCISILHPPGNDEYGYEDAGEHWLPVHTIESILVSVTSLLASESPNTESPANIDAAKELRDDPASYKKKVRRLARKSAEDCFD